MKCPQCNGTGIEEKTSQIFINKKAIGKSNMCNKCFGKGKLDWIENITGKEGMVPKTDSFHQFADIVSYESTTFHGG